MKLTANKPKNLCRWGAVATVALTGGVAAAQPQTDVVDPTGWYWQYNVEIADVADLVNNNNQRVVDIEIESTSPFRVSAVTVTNSGDYAKSWWWYFGQTEADVNASLNANNSRLIDIEPYETAGGLRFATVQVRNTGADQTSAHGWYFGYTGGDVVNWVNANPAYRIIDLQPYLSNGNLRYAFAFVRNSGNTASPWAYYVNVSLATIQTYMSNNSMRLIDLEEQTNGNYSAVMVPNDGNAWWYYYNVTASYLTEQINQNAARLIDLQFNPSNGRFWAVMRRNDNDLAIDVNLQMRDITDGSSGFLLDEMDGPEHAGVQEWRVFEPASLLKTWYHAGAMRSISIGNDALGNLMSVNEGLSGSCPTGLTPTLQTVQQALTDMMVSSSNTDTEAIRQRYGQVWMDAVAGALGMSDTDTNHVIGCFCNSVRNEITLDDLSGLYQTVNNGYLGAQTNNFYDIMINSLTTNQGGGLTFQQVLDTELAGSALDAAEQADFQSLVYHASKGGSYTCNGAVANEGQFRSRGGIFRLPFREGCRFRTREYMYGAWVNDATNGNNASLAVGTGATELFRDRVRAAIDTWEASACGCPADYNNDGVLDNGDISAFVNGFLSGEAAADFNNDGVIDNGDIGAFVEAFLRGC
ncbi:MAG: GC-type dockerin domain-anchored protein [Phycisphaerales bacterium JB040]